MDKGSNGIRSGWRDDEVFHDAAKNATQEVNTSGLSLKLEWDIDDHTITSISAWDSAEIFSRADVDGGYGCGFCGLDSGYGFIPFASESADAIPDHDQITQELRLSSNLSGDWNYQVGVFYFDEDLTIESFSFDTLANGVQNGYAIQHQQTNAWAVFGSVDYEVSNDLKVTAGLRYSDDKKDFTAKRLESPIGGGTKNGAANLSDSHVSWDLSATYKLNDDVNLFARAANSFRAPSIQGRILFGDEVTVAESETINSIETGIKSDILDGRGRLNMTVFYYQMDDQQLTAVGGGANFNRLLNADKTTGYGFELDSEWVLADDFFATFNFSYNNTELKDDSLYVANCGACTIIDPVLDPSVPDADKQFSINGNSLPHAPEWIANFTLRYSKEIGAGELFAYTDWSYRSEIDFFLYESVEFTGEALLEGGVSTGYKWGSDDNEYQVSAFVRNLTDERVVIGGVDFNNNTGIVNEGRFVGVEFKAKFF
jgi:iron complex outermembrane receptor protein